MKADKDVVRAAIHSCHYTSHATSVLKFAAETVKTDKDVVLAAVLRDVFGLFEAAEAMRADIQVTTKGMP